jgi:hypothetical protein
MELPTISTGTYASNTASYAGDFSGVGTAVNLDWIVGNNAVGADRRPQAFPVLAQYGQFIQEEYEKKRQAVDDYVNRQKTFTAPTITLDKGATMAVQPRRLVRIIIADPDAALPLDKVLLYNGEEKFTDATDQELFFEVDIKSLLEKHNEYRATVVDPESKDKKDFLKKARVRDLRMTVLTITSF